ncbi:uncharacterized protein LOC135110420 isoform X2 [Scylla paramamosain]|uniref:uncharacterized protein LOC135110420 isoform X2 n=1 Tax=Scylla paramamosain TaxID=85552 RepID=UPI003083738F
MKGQGNLTCDVTPLSSSHWLDSITCSPRRVLIGHGILLLLTSGPVYGWRRSFLIDVILIDFPHWWKCVGVAGRSSALERMPMMMARPCFVALLCVALWCGVVFGQEGTSAADPKQDPTPDSGATPAQSPKQMADAGGRPRLLLLLLPPPPRPRPREPTLLVAMAHIPTQPNA